MSSRTFLMHLFPSPVEQTFLRSKIQFVFIYSLQISPEKTKKTNYNNKEEIKYKKHSLPITKNHRRRSKLF